jgi:hypothetical protein
VSCHDDGAQTSCWSSAVFTITLAHGVLGEFTSCRLLGRDGMRPDLHLFRARNSGGRRDVAPKVFPARSATAFHTRVTAQRLLNDSKKNLVWVSQSGINNKRKIFFKNRFSVKKFLISSYLNRCMSRESNFAAPLR